MNRRGFLTTLFSGLIVAPTLPQIVTFGLKLKKQEILGWTDSDLELYNQLPFYLAKKFDPAVWWSGA